jgi:methylated-DNA-[protein]-cysteine S-methyltransferase
MLTTTLPSPLGPLTLAASDDGALTGLWTDGRAPDPAWRADHGPFATVAERLEAYFAGQVVDFAGLPTAAAGTPWQRRVWAALREIPYGATTTYGALAARLGAPTASRAVGAANGRNPISIVVPCHRVIGSSGALTGYAGGLDRKRALLALEALKPDAEVPIPGA